MVAFLIFLFIPTLSWATVTAPTLPTSNVDTTMPTVTGSSLTATCGTLQSQLNAAAALNANLTHEIILAVGTTCTGPYKLPSHTGGTGWILIKGANHDSLPASGVRISTGYTSSMPTIKYGDDGIAYVGAFSAQTGAQRYRIIGIYMVQDSTINPNWAIVTTGYSNQNATNTGYIILDRVIIQDTDTAHQTVRAVEMNAQLGNTAVIDSYISGIQDIGNDDDTQAVVAWSNPGPMLIQNNYLEASGENVMLGGADPATLAVHPANATIKWNTFDKASRWWGSATNLTKTLLELKTAQKVLIEGNDFNNMPWNDAGYAFRLTPRNNDGGQANSEVADVTIRYNKFVNVTNAFFVIPSDDQGGGIHSKHFKRLSITENLIYGLGWICGGGAACGSLYFQTAGDASCTDSSPTCEMEDLTFTHNTVDNIGSTSSMFFVENTGQKNLDFSNNLINIGGAQGAISLSQYGTAFLSAAWGATYTWANNRLGQLNAGEASGNYPAGSNTYAADYTNFKWNNRSTRDYTLQSTSPALSAGSDGLDQGVVFSLYNAARSQATASCH